MNKLFLYISIFFVSFLLSCAQQSDSSMQEERISEEEQMLEENLVQQTYFWAEEATEYSDLADQNETDGTQDEKSKEEAEILSNKDDLAATGGLTSKIGIETPAKNEEKLIKAFAKQHVEDLLDLSAIYISVSDNDDMKKSIVSEIMASLPNGDFESFQQSLFFEAAVKKKISWIKLEQTAENNYEGVIELSTKSASNQVAFQIIGKVTDYGLSREFLILGIAD